jgi:methionine sulfoxide reductase heme-binding subunit
MSSITMPVRPTSGASSGGAVAILGAAALAIAATTAYALATHGTGDQGIVLVTRHLARLAFPLFIAAFTASALLELAPSAPTRWLVRNRRFLGLAFAMVMFAHLAAIFALWSVREDEPHFGLDRVVGGLGYVFIALMAATSNDGAVRALGRERWSRLHRVGLYLLWFIFTVTYLGRISEEPSFLLGLGVALGALALRIVAWRHRRVSA